MKLDNSLVQSDCHGMLNFQDLIRLLVLPIGALSGLLNTQVRLAKLQNPRN
jgi:hypothetical protein